MGRSNGVGGREESMQKNEAMVRGKVLYMRWCCRIESVLGSI